MSLYARNQLVSRAGDDHQEWFTTVFHCVHKIPRILVIQAGQHTGTAHSWAYMLFLEAPSRPEHPTSFTIHLPPAPPPEPKVPPAQPNNAPTAGRSSEGPTDEFWTVCLHFYVFQKLCGSWLQSQGVEFPNTQPNLRGGEGRGDFMI